MEDIAAASLGAPADAFADVRRLLEQALLREEAARPKGKPIAPPADDEPVDEIVIDAPDPDEAETIRRREVMGLLERLLFGADTRMPETAAAQLPPARVQQFEDAVKGIRGDSPSRTKDKTCGEMVQEYLAKQKVRIGVKQVSADRWNGMRFGLSHTIAFCGPDAAISTITAEKLEGFYYFCLAKIGEKEWSMATARDVFSTGRQWIRWLCGRGVIPTPPNLLDKNFRFGSTLKAIETWTVEEVKYVIGEAPDKLKLALLLMANIGATQIDVNDLLDTEVDWREGRITRKRSKTGDKSRTPTVCYKLWPSTFTLLKQHRSGAERVLLTAKGRPLIRKSIVGERISKTDVLAGCYDALKKRIGFKKPMKLLRKTSATMLDSDHRYERFSTLFLGHAPTSIKDRHYAAPPQALFDEAVLWLGQQLGLAD
ncbi:MAG TPA: hypothetical protein VN688_12400 [Gemmataceae bacterium]|nr:hypothetical protein [Gemmataceae bacterium]